MGIIDLCKQMNLQPLELVPYGGILFDIWLQLLDFLLFERELLFLDDYLIDLIVFFKPHKQLKDDTSCDQFKQSSEDMYQPFLSTDLEHIIFAVVGEDSDNFHGCFGHIEEHIVGFAVTHNRNSKQGLLDLLEFFVSRSHTEVGDLLEGIGFVGLVGIASNEL